MYLGDTFIVEMCESDSDDDMLRDNRELLININDRFLVERNLTNAKVCKHVQCTCLAANYVMSKNTKRDWKLISLANDLHLKHCTPYHSPGVCADNVCVTFFESTSLHK